MAARRGPEENGIEKETRNDLITPIPPFPLKKGEGGGSLYNDDPRDRMEENVGVG
jgi:hypothetical protein